LNDNVGISRDVFSPELGKKSRVQIVNIAGLGADRDADGLPWKKHA
jgi:hypothetical protein